MKSFENPSYLSNGRNAEYKNSPPYILSWNFITRDFWRFITPVHYHNFNPLLGELSDRKPKIGLFLKKCLKKLLLNDKIYLDKTPFASAKVYKIRNNRNQIIRHDFFG